MKTILTIIAISLSGLLTAQTFIPPTANYSKKEEAILIMKDGQEKRGYYDGFYFDKNILVEAVKFKPLDGKSEKIPASEIKYLYVKPSDFGKISNAKQFIEDATKWGKEDYRNDLISDGYTIYENNKVETKKGTEERLLQLINPHFSSKVKVYNNPDAGESMSLGVGPIKALGGAKTSYYIQTGSSPAFLLEKKKYDEEFTNIYTDCEEFTSKHSANWSDFEKQVAGYTKDCSK